MPTYSKIILTNSGVQYAEPFSNNLDYGELAINYNDGKIFFKDNADNIRTIASVGYLNELEDHIAHPNPHNITKNTIGLENVENLAPINLPISNATQNALDAKVDNNVIGELNELDGGLDDENIVLAINSLNDKLDSEIVTFNDIQIGTPNESSGFGGIEYEVINGQAVFTYTKPNITDMGGVGVDAFEVTQLENGTGTLIYDVNENDDTGTLIYDAPTLAGLGGLAIDGITIDSQSSSTASSLAYDNGTFTYTSVNISGLNNDVQALQSRQGDFTSYTFDNLENIDSNDSIAKILNAIDEKFGSTATGDSLGSANDKITNLQTLVGTTNNLYNQDDFSSESKNFFTFDDDNKINIKQALEELGERVLTQIDAQIKPNDTSINITTSVIKDQVYDLWVEVNTLNAAGISNKIELTDLSVNANSASTTSSLAYNNGNGTFTYTPVNISNKIELGDLSVNANSASTASSLSYNNGIFTYTPVNISDKIELTNLSSSNQSTNDGTISLGYNNGNGTFTLSAPALATNASPSTTRVTADYQVLVSDRVILVDDDAATGDVIITLPDPAVAADGWAISIKKLGSTNDVIIRPFGAENIDEDTEIVVHQKNKALRIVTDGTNWLGLYPTPSTGWAYYEDSASLNSPTPVSLTANGTIQLNIDTLGPNTNTDFLPDGIVNFWDVADNKILAQKIGDTYEIKVKFDIDVPNNDTLVSFVLDIGNKLNIPEEINILEKHHFEYTVSGTHSETMIFKVFALNDFVNNGGRIYITPDNDIDLSNISIFIKRDFSPV